MTCNEVEHFSIVPGHKGRAAAVNAVRRRLRSKLVYACIATGDSRLARRGTVAHVERQARVA